MPADSDLGTRLSRGDRNALAELFTLYHEKLSQMLQFRMPSLLAGRLDVDDLLQESYLAAEKRIDSYDDNGDHAPLVWARLIALQTLADQCRRHLSAQRRDACRELSIHASANMPGATSLSMASRLIDELTSPSGVAMRTEAAARLESAIESMEAIDREILVLRHFELLGNAESAAVLGIEPKAASIRYVRAIRRLKAICDKENGERDPS